MQKNFSDKYGSEKDLAPSSSFRNKIKLIRLKIATIFRPCHELSTQTKFPQ